MPEIPPTVEDVRRASGGEYFVVAPQNEGSGPGIIFLHWFDEAPNANRTQFLDEAKQLADHGVVSILPQLSFPWAEPPTGASADQARIEAELAWLLQIHAALIGRPDVDPGQVIVVGHDFGAMHGTLLMREINALAAVLIAATPRWADWFLPFWPIETDRFEYLKAMDAFDPIRAIPTAGCPILFQFGERDFYIALMTALEFYNSAPEPKILSRHDTGHAMDVAGVRDDRMAFILDQLQIEE